MPEQDQFRSGTIVFKTPPDAARMAAPEWGFAVRSTLHDLQTEGSRIVRFYSPDLAQAMAFAREEVLRLRAQKKAKRRGRGRADQLGHQAGCHADLICVVRRCSWRATRGSPMG